MVTIDGYYAPDEGDQCPLCGGCFFLPKTVGCSCHLSPPCSACLDTVIKCGYCSATVESLIGDGHLIHEDDMKMLLGFLPEGQQVKFKQIYPHGAVPPHKIKTALNQIIRGLQEKAADLLFELINQRRDYMLSSELYKERCKALEEQLNNRKKESK
jgi:hypothetical protein